MMKLDLSAGFTLSNALLALPLALWLLASAAAFADPLAETREVIFSGEGSVLAAKGSELGSPAAIYEHVRNTHEYALYHGSRSNSINTFLGQRGSDVDIASVLIAMLRSQGIPARYAIANVRAPAADVASWLGVKNVALAEAMLNDQGIQSVVRHTVAGVEVIDFEHVWAQAEVPYGQYRGAAASSTNCSLPASDCQWVDLDASYKLREFKAQFIDIYGVVNFDYTQYYNAIDNAAYRDKGPLEIYEAQILAYLKTNYPGKTLDDVMDPGVIVPVRNRILPASLPYQVIGEVETYDSVQLHDDATTGKHWAKFVTMETHIVSPPNCTETGVIPCYDVTSGAGVAALADLSTKRLTYTWDPIAEMVSVRLDGVVIATPIGLFGFGIALHSPFTLRATLDGAPSIVSGEPDGKIEVVYDTMEVGGYYVIGTGGDTSNWSQVHRAAAQLLEANRTWPIVLDPAGVPYVDQGPPGWDALDTPLLNHPEAQDALTGELLYVAMTQYFTRFVENTRRLDHLNHVVSPIEGFIGVVSSTYDVEYLDNTAFSIMPGGLLIDMKGVVFNGTWRVDQPAAYASDHFELLGHEGSSLEHEIWQELTGFDAVSTVRGIQMALASPAAPALLTPENTGTGNNMASQFAGFQFNNNEPSGFSVANFDVFTTRPGIWSYSTPSAEKEMELMRRNVTASSTPLERSPAIYTYNPTSSIYAWVKCADTKENDLLSASPSTNYTDYLYCDGTTYSGTRDQVLAALQNRFLTYTIPVSLGTNGQQYFDYFDRNKGFDRTQFVYRALPLADDQHSIDTVARIRNNVEIGAPGARWEYAIPGRKTEGSLYRFSVYLEKIFNTATGRLASQDYKISNESFVAGGGWVDGTDTLVPALALPGTSVIVPSFSNEVFTDQNLVAQTNNDQIRTPSTSDPVSTVTGNMYHDETDLRIKGRGLDFTFTRSYNSAPARGDVDGPFGFGWTHSYGMQLRSNDYGVCPNCTQAQASVNGNNITSSISYIDERGGEHTYILNGDGGGGRSVVRAAPGDFDTLQLNTPASGQHTLLFRNGVKYVFNNASDLPHVPNQIARLSYIEDPYNNRLTMGYDGSGRLTSVTDNLAISGRTGLAITYYGSTSHIKDITDWASPPRVLQYGYDGNGNLTSYTNPRGDVFTYTYHPATHLLKERIYPELANGNQVKTTFQYYENKRAFSNANAKGETETLDYDLYRQRTQVTDPRGFVREHFYDPLSGALIKLEEPDGGVLQFANTDDGIRYSKTDGLGFETQYSYQSGRSITSAASNNFGRLSREHDALGHNKDYSYGVFDQPTTVTNFRGNPVTRSYYSSTNASTDAVNGKLYEVRATVNGASNVLLERNTYYANTSSPAFGQPKRRIEFIDPSNSNRQRITDYVYASNGIDLLTVTVTGATTPGISIVRGYTSDAVGRMLTETLTRRTSASDSTPIAVTKTFVYDPLDRVISATNARGDRKVTVYDGNGNVKLEKIEHYSTISRPGCAPPSGGYVVCTYATHSYDEANRRVSTTDILGRTTTFAYDAAGNLIAQTDANGHTQRFEYDGMNRRTAAIDANGHRSELTYDLAGRVIGETDANGHTTKKEYDQLGRLTSVTSPEGRRTEYQYDFDGNQTHVLDANAIADPLQPRNTQGVSTYREFDELGRLKREVDALNGQTLYSYDLLGNVTAVTDAENQTTAFVYNDLGRLIEVRDPFIESGTDRVDKVTLYDEAGNPLMLEDRSGRQQVRSYDILDRLTNVVYQFDGSQESYGFDDFGDLVTVANDDVTYTLGYTARHELASKLDSRLGKSLSWTYDAAGNVATRTDYEGAVTEYEYDSTNRLVAERNPEFLQISYHYDAAGRLIDRILSSGARTAYGYDDDNRQTSLRNYSASGALIESYGYQRDQVGNIKQVSDAVSGRTVNYSYDGDYRLKTVDSNTNSEDRSYTYDKVGNRKTLVANGTTYYYCYHALNCSLAPVGNRLYNIRTGSLSGPFQRQFTYDQSGRVLAKQDGSGTPIYTLVYDGKGLVSSAGGSLFAYDPMGYRIQKDARLYHLEREHLDAVYDPSGQVKEHYLRGAVIDEIVAGYRDESSTSLGTLYSFHHDQINSVTALSGHAGAVAETTRFDAFGAPLNLATPGTGNDLLFTGREYDRATGLYYYRARYYDPEIGRFTSEDPLGFKGGINFFAYAENSPLRYNDPTGEVIPLPVITGLIGGSGAVLGTCWDGCTVAEGVSSFIIGAAAGSGLSYLLGPALIASGGTTAFVGELGIGATSSALGNAGTQAARIQFDSNLSFERDFSFMNVGIAATGGAAGSLFNATVSFGLATALSETGLSSGSLLGQSLAMATPEQFVSGAFATGVDIGVGYLQNRFSESSGGCGFCPAGDVLGPGPWLPSASGGFVLYPSRPNLNQASRVYRKGG